MAQISPHKSITEMSLPSAGKTPIDNGRDRYAKDDRMRTQLVMKCILRMVFIDGLFDD